MSEPYRRAIEAIMDLDHALQEIAGRNHGLRIVMGHGAREAFKLAIEEGNEYMVPDPSAHGMHICGVPIDTYTLTAGEWQG